MTRFPKLCALLALTLAIPAIVLPILTHLQHVRLKCLNFFFFDGHIFWITNLRISSADTQSCNVFQIFHKSRLKSLTSNGLTSTRSGSKNASLETAPMGNNSGRNIHLGWCPVVTLTGYSGGLEETAQSNRPTSQGRRNAFAMGGGGVAETFCHQGELNSLEMVSD